MKLIKSVLFALLATIGAASSASVLVVKDTSVTDTIPGLTGYSTTGADMTGMRVTATFADGFTETLSWAGTGGSGGGVTGTGWGLSVAGDTYSASWLFNIGAGLGQLVSFKLDASGPGQVTLFDTLFDGDPGTDDSASGVDFELLNCSSCDATAAYSNVVAVGGNAAVGDNFHTLLVTFNNATGPRTNFTFSQDTDNDSRILVGFVPEPGSVALMALAMLGMGAALRRRS